MIIFTFLLMGLIFGILSGVYYQKFERPEGFRSGSHRNDMSMGGSYSDDPKRLFNWEVANKCLRHH